MINHVYRQNSRPLLLVARSPVTLQQSRRHRAAHRDWNRDAVIDPSLFVGAGAIARIGGVAAQRRVGRDRGVGIAVRGTDGAFLPQADHYAACARGIIGQGRRADVDADTLIAADLVADQLGVRRSGDHNTSNSGDSQSALDASNGMKITH